MKQHVGNSILLFITVNNEAHHFLVHVYYQYLRYLVDKEPTISNQHKLQISVTH